MKTFNFGLAALFFAILIAPQAHAQETVQATIDTNSAITTADGVDMDFEDWFILVNAPDNAVTITMATGTGNLTTGGITTSIVQNLTDTTGTPGTVTVDLPSGSANTVVQMQRTAITQFADTNLTLSATTYGTATEGEDQALATTTNVPVTVVTGGTPETVRFGGTITFSATPTNGTHTASFDVSFAY